MRHISLMLVGVAAAAISVSPASATERVNDFETPFVMRLASKRV
jgi:hypothetical protein